MRKATALIAIAMVAVLAACSAPTPTPTATPVPPTATPTPTATATPEPTPTAAIPPEIADLLAVMDSGIDGAPTASQMQCLREQTNFVEQLSLAYTAVDLGEQAKALAAVEEAYAHCGVNAGQ